MSASASQAIDEADLRASMTMRGIELAQNGVPLLFFALIVVGFLVCEIFQALAVTGLALVVSIWRLWMGKRAKEVAEQLSLHQEQGLRRSFELNALICGLVWSALVFVASRNGRAEAEVLMLVVVTASAGVASASSSLVGRAYELLVVPQLGSLLVALVGRNVIWPDWAYGVLVLGYGATLLKASASARSQARRQFENAAELDRLRELTVSSAREALLRQQTENRLEREVEMSMLSHELRTPLQTVVAVAALFKVKLADRADLMTHNLRLETAAADVLRYSDDLAAMYRANESGSLHVVTAWWQPSVVLAIVLREIEPRAVSKGLRLEASLPSLWVNTDPMRVRQILHNLVVNAVKYTPSGKVKVLAAVPPPSDSGKSELLLTVEDTGPGVPLDDLDRLFQPWERGTSTSRGLGLGLPVVRALANSLGASLKFENTDTGGARFTLRIPVATASSRPQVEQATLNVTHIREQTDGKPRLLVVDDDLEVLTSVRTLAESEGFVVETASSAQDGWNLLAQRSFYAVFVDLQMPKVDGYAFAVHAREIGQPTADCLIVSCSALPIDPNRAHIFDGHLDKPVGPGRIAQAVESARLRMQH